MQCKKWPPCLLQLWIREADLQSFCEPRPESCLHATAHIRSARKPGFGLINVNQCKPTAYIILACQCMSTMNEAVCSSRGRRTNSSNKQIHLDVSQCARAPQLLSMQPSGPPPNQLKLYFPSQNKS
eukprot:914939-Pelagomonas_calceolata.AAC.1